MSFLELAAERYSVRAYSDKPVEAAKIEKILQAAKLAPTARNLQPQVIYMLTSKEAVAKASSVCQCIYGAPVVALVCYDKNRVWTNPLQKGYDSGEIDCSIVCTHMMMAAWEEGIGSCWVRFFNADNISQAFNLPDNIVPVSILDLGYAAEGCKPNAANHSSSRAQEEMVTFL